LPNSWRRAEICKLCLSERRRDRPDAKAWDLRGMTMSHHRPDGRGLRCHTSTPMMASCAFPQSWHSKVGMDSPVGKTAAHKPIAQKTTAQLSRERLIPASPKGQAEWPRQFQAPQPLKVGHGRRSPSPCIIENTADKVSPSMKCQAAIVEEPVDQPVGRAVVCVSQFRSVPPTKVTRPLSVPVIDSFAAFGSFHDLRAAYVRGDY